MHSINSFVVCIKLVNEVSFPFFSVAFVTCLHFLKNSYSRHNCLFFNWHNSLEATISANCGKRQYNINTRQYNMSDN